MQQCRRMRHHVACEPTATAAGDALAAALSRNAARISLCRGVRSRVARRPAAHRPPQAYAPPLATYLRRTCDVLATYLRRRTTHETGTLSSDDSLAQSP
jgi:hypothetical protein